MSGGVILVMKAHLSCLFLTTIVQSIKKNLHLHFPFEDYVVRFKEQRFIIMPTRKYFIMQSIRQNPAQQLLL